MSDPRQQGTQMKNSDNNKPQTTEINEETKMKTYRQVIKNFHKQPIM